MAIGGVNDLHKKVYEQGDIINIENLKVPVLVVSKNFFNETGEVMVCPIIAKNTNSPLHVGIVCDLVNGEVHCEKVKLFDLNMRGSKKIGNIGMRERMLIADMIQSLFDYV